MSRVVSMEAINVGVGKVSGCMKFYRQWVHGIYTAFDVITLVFCDVLFLCRCSLYSA